MFYAFFGGFYPGEGFFYCIKISRNIDPACGSGSLLIRALNEAPIALSGYGQEKDTTTAGLAKMNTVLHDWATATIVSGNTFSDPQFFEEGSDETILRRFDYIVANPPFSIKNWTDGVKGYGRFDGYGERPPEKNGDYAWLMHILKSLKPTGKAAVILPHGVLFRGNGEGEIRKALIKTGFIKGIIGLPANLFYGTSIHACIIIIDKEDADERTGIFMIDASRDFVKDGNKNRLRERDIYKIVTTFNEQIKDDPHYARFVPMSEITGKNDYNLNISRYIDSGVGEDLQSIEAHLKGGIPAHDVDSMERYWNIFAQLKGKLFSVLRDGFYQLNVPKDDIRSTIHNDEEFSAYADKLDTAFAGWREEVDGELRHMNAYIQTKKLIARLAECILTQFECVELIDKYDVYQVLLEYWLDVLSDDVYVVIHDGYEAGRDLSYEYVVKTHKEGDETVIEVTDKVKSWDGKLIPKTIMIDTYFSEEAKAIDAAEVIIADSQAQIDELLVSAEDGSAVAELMDEKGKVSTKALKAAIEEIRSKIQSEEISELTALLALLPMKKKDMETYLTKHPLCVSARNEKGNVNATSIKACIATLRETLHVPEMYSEDYEQLMTLFDLIAKNDEKKKMVKVLKAALEEKVKQKYTALTVEEIKELLVNKKWYDSIYNGIDALYLAISHNITDRIIELAERYEDTLPALSTLVDDYEARVKSHLERMGFVW
ncbi:N-6 DNA methylase [Zongyangia hominis]|uniref:site-specific DNA-methyltransferase (adenine-specific) n=1 Tax=Zongyangia hominis TaxID=2763677 RepID=A0A926E8N8_9FIRM|nr:N-6 DNA methylase [Zongyangia hominis]MBC8569930.1 N-6 DNA methylase [Zongyangia hominis]